MTKERLKSKLAAILGADVEGYCRLIREDKEATIRTLTSYRAAMSNLIQREIAYNIERPGFAGLNLPHDRGIIGCPLSGAKKTRYSKTAPPDRLAGV